MDKDIHKVTYEDLFSGHKFSEPIEVIAKAHEKIIIFSDSHIQRKFDQRQYERLIEIVKAGDIIIINGDLWWDSHISFEEFINGKWGKLLEALKSKKTYYLFGNHDMPYLSDERIYNFCTQAGFRIKLYSGKNTFNVEHGHLISSPIIKMILKVFQRRPKLLSILTYPFGLLHDLARIIFVRHGKKMMGSVNNTHKKLKGEDWLIVGHTHAPEVDELNKYINLGFTHKGYFSWLEVLNGQFTLKEIKS